MTLSHANSDNNSAFIDVAKLVREASVNEIDRCLYFVRVTFSVTRILNNKLSVKETEITTYICHLKI